MPFELCAFAPLKILYDFIVVLAGGCAVQVAMKIFETKFGYDHACASPDMHKLGRRACAGESIRLFVISSEEDAVGDQQSGAATPVVWMQDQYAETVQSSVRVHANLTKMIRVYVGGFRSCFVPEWSA